MHTQIFKTTFYGLFLTTLLFTSSCHRDTDPVINEAQPIACGDINSDVTWADRGLPVDYTLDCIVSVNAKLTIEPGVTIFVKSGAGIIIENTGALVASGSAAKNIILKSEQDVAGVWKGIFVKSNDVLNEMNYCRISNGGSASFDGNSTKLANIRVALNAKLKLQNSTISKSAQDGLLCDGLDGDEQSPITLFSGNTFTDNLNYPISALGSIATKLDGTGSVYTGNTYNKILLRGGLLQGANVWTKLSVPYYVNATVSVGYSSTVGNLTIEPGTTVQFGSDAGLTVGQYSATSWMKIIGDASNRITLTGETALPGSWKGVAFQCTNTNNRVSYTDVSYGGGSSFTGNTSELGNILAGAWSAGSFTIDNTSISNSAAYGIYVTLPSPTISVPGSVTYSGNASGDYFEE
jgi:hypothetical protein